MLRLDATASRFAEQRKQAESGEKCALQEKMDMPRAPALRTGRLLDACVLFSIDVTRIRFPTIYQDYLWDFLLNRFGGS